MVNLAMYDCTYFPKNIGLNNIAKGIWTNSIVFSSPDILILALEKDIAEPVVATITVPRSLFVLVVALVLRLFPGGSPQQLALVRVGAARSFVAIALANFARGSVDLVNV